MIYAALLKQFVYGYDKAGNRTSEQIDMSVSSATHNDLNQATQRTGAGPTRFKGTLSEPGTATVGGNAAQVVAGTNFTGYANTSPGTNVVTITATDYSGNARTNRYQLIVTNNTLASVLSYDRNGNLASTVSTLSTNTYEWDAANRLVKITQLSNNIQTVSEFSYDGLGRRARAVEKQNGAVVSDSRFF